MRSIIDPDRVFSLLLNVVKTGHPLFPRVEQHFGAHFCPIFKHRVFTRVFK